MASPPKDHKALYKQQKQEAKMKLRERKRSEEHDIRKKNRGKVQDSKRMRLEEAWIEADDITMEEVGQFIQTIIHSTGDKLAALKKLKAAFSQGSLFIEEFLRKRGALPALVGLLSGSDSEMQLEAAWCITNLGTGVHDGCLMLAKEAGSYLVTYLTSSNGHLQDQCAWALGNIAADSAECRDILIKQGVLNPLLNLLQSPMPDVVQSAAFALSNLARGEDAHIREFVELGAIPTLIEQLTIHKENSEIVAEVAWVLTYLTARSETIDHHLILDIVKNVSCLMIDTASQDPDCYQVLTPALRCTGNACSKDDNTSQTACKNPQLIPTLCKLSQSHHRHVRKETLWVLSNLSGHVDLAKEIINNGLLPPLVHLLSDTFDIKKEAGYSVCNLASHGEEFCKKLLDAGVMKGMVSLLKCASDLEAVNLALSFMEMIFRQTDNGVHVFEECDGLVGLEAVEYHSIDSIRVHTAELLEKYFYKDTSGLSPPLSTHVVM